MSRLNIYIDDSGQLHNNYKSDYFVYGGYWCLSSNDADIKKYYSILKKNIFKSTREIKGSSLSSNKRIQIIKRLTKKYSKEMHPIFLVVYIPSETLDFDNPEAVQLHKNYLIRRFIETAILDFRHQNSIRKNYVNIFIDNQTQTVLKSRDSLEKYLNKKFGDKYSSNQYGLISDAKFKAVFKDSKKDNGIQICDILANSKFKVYNDDCTDLKRSLRCENDVKVLHLPHGFHSNC